MVSDGNTSSYSSIQGRKNKKCELNLSPTRSILVITDKGPREYSPEEITSSIVGWKAYGISSIPQEWVPPFFIITSTSLSHCPESELLSWINQSLDSIGIDRSRQVIVRSSGASETIRHRGLHESKECPQNRILSVVKDLSAQISATNCSYMHWIIQELAVTGLKGHLSNERHLRRENRDWVYEYESRYGSPWSTGSLAVRNWRDGKDINDIDLRCNSEYEISVRLKQVAMWVSKIRKRIHFEWVWNGKRIYIVQADEEDPTLGSDPHELLAVEISQDNYTYALQSFHIACPEDYERYSKLKNAKLYTGLGYHMPTFFVLNDNQAIVNILSGTITKGIENDLKELIRRPLILRTDGTDIPSDKREMLPRSDGLRSYEEARNWLLETFASKIKQGALESANLCLIGHYFIPSIASAWARAIPSERIVRIESLWGIPEGLYWYSHDTYEVDTQNVQLNQDSILSEQYTVKERLRFKGTFVAPDQSGKWKPLQTKQPFDLRRSINHKNWLFEIAHKTRQIAELERYPVSVMWFVDNHHHATEHKVLPWFHSKLQMIEQPKAAPRQKRKSASDYKIQSSEDFIRLQSDLESGKYIERVIIAPEDAALIRDQDFAKKLALLAKTKGFVIELAGGILSHAFYILQREGAQVECVDLFGADEDIVEYYKIVRDKIPQIIERRGERVDTIQLTGDALVQALQKKLVEEAFEAFDAREGMDILAELADLQEVIKALCSSIGASTNDLETERKRKEMHRGGFEKGLMLTKTTTPHSIQKLPSSANPSNIETIMLPIPKPIISIASSLLDQPIYRRPDLRMVNQQPEKLFTFETEVAKANVNDTQSFSMPYGSKIQDYGITIELKRIKSKIRAIIRLRSGPSQLQLQFPNETK